MTSTRKEITDAEITAQISQFEEAFKNLLLADAQLGGFGGVASTLWLWGALTTWGFLFVGVCLVSYNMFFLHREEKKNQFSPKLEGLLTLYRAMIAENDKAIFDPKTLKLLKTLAPYIVHTEQLLPANFDNSSPEIKEKYRETLSQPPHNLPRLTQAKRSEESPSIVTRGLSLFSNALTTYTGQTLPVVAMSTFKTSSHESVTWKRVKAACFQHIYGDEQERKTESPKPS